MHISMVLCKSFSSRSSPSERHDSKEKLHLLLGQKDFPGSLFSYRKRRSFLHEIFFLFFGISERFRNKDNRADLKSSQKKTFFCYINARDGKKVWTCESSISRESLKTFFIYRKTARVDRKAN